MKNHVPAVMRISMIVNIILSLLKILTGIIGKSGALIADGIHSFSDLITDIFAIFGSIISRKPADEKHPFGHGKLEYLTSIVISLVILTLGLTIIYKSPTREITNPSIIVLIVTVFTITSKYFLANYIIKSGYKYKSNILISSGFESKTDVVSSIVVLISSIMMIISSKVEIFKYADIMASIIVGLFIVKTGFILLKDNISTILGETETDPEFINKIKDIILKNEEIESIDSLYIIKYGTYNKAICEVSMNPYSTLKEVHDVLDKIDKSIKRNEKSINYVSIHVNPGKEVKDA